MYESVAFLSQLISTSLIEQNWTTSKVFVGIIEILTELHRVTHLHPLNRADWPAPAAQIRTVIETMVLGKSRNFYTGIEISVRRESDIVSLFYILEPNSFRRC